MTKNRVQLYVTLTGRAFREVYFLYPRRYHWAILCSTFRALGKKAG
ncbi:hypothetical protein [Dysgonomonas sp. 521]|nr:hypothetical protein [Dysgonomonas sp. 521]